MRAVFAFHALRDRARGVARGGRTAFLVVFAVAVLADAGRGRAGSISLEEADSRLAVASRLLEGGIYDQAIDTALSILNDPTFREPDTATPAEAQEILARREAARFTLERGRFGLARTEEEFLDVAEEFAFLFQNRYRLTHPAYNLQSAYWSGRAYEEAKDYPRAVAMYSRVGGFNLPPRMEGDAARRTSDCLREMAEAIPFSGTQRDRQRRARLLDQAIDELTRARNAYPVGRERKDLELDLIGLRLARRDPDYIREALAEADAFLAAEPARDALRARAALFRAMGSERLGNAEDAATWFRRVATEENPSSEDLREAELGLALALREIAESSPLDAKGGLLRESAEAFQRALEGTGNDPNWDRARTILALTLLDLGRPSPALETIMPVIERGGAPTAAFFAAGRANLARGRLEEALAHLFAATRPSARQDWLRLSAAQSAVGAARRRGKYALALVLARQASRILRRGRVYGALLDAEFFAMELLLQLGKTSGPMTLSADEELIRGRDDAEPISLETRQRAASHALAGALGAVFAKGVDADRAYDVAVLAETARELAGAGPDDLETAVGMIGHLRNRRPGGVSESAILSREGEAYFALAQARARQALSAAAPDEAEIAGVLDGFNRASASYQLASSGGQSGSDALDQGVVNLATGDFLLAAADKWDDGPWAARAGDWRREAEQRIGSAISPLDQALARSAPGSAAGFRARWARARALELLSEWRPAAGAFAWFMNNSEVPRILRINAARGWATCMSRLGEYAQAFVRLAPFARMDGEAAFIAGQLAENLGDLAAAYQHYLFAADPDAPVAQPETPGRRQEAAFKAATLALNHPAAIDRFADPAELRESARQLLERTARADLSGAWTINMLNELGRSWLEEKPEGWRRAYRMASQAAELPTAAPRLRRAMHMLASEALVAGENFDAALDELDHARDLLETPPNPVERADAASITLAMADIYQAQGRREDAIRAYADVFASYPEAQEQAASARIKSAQLILSGPEAGPREREQARAILSGLPDRALAEEILGKH